LDQFEANRVDTASIQPPAARTLPACSAYRCHTPTAWRPRCASRRGACEGELFPLSRALV